MTDALLFFSRLGEFDDAPSIALEVVRPGLLGELPVVLPHGPSRLHHLAWRVAGGGVAAVYVIEREGAVAHYSYVVRKDARFPFMDNEDLHIGPCWTAPVARGQGLFPAVLRRIAADYGGKRLWIFAAAPNQASRAGILKAGFEEVGRGRRLGPRYVLEGAR